MFGFPQTIGQTVILLAVAVFVTLVAVTPPLRFLRNGWPLKTKQILNTFDPGTIQYYFTRYWSHEPVVIDGRPSATLLPELVAPRDEQMLTAQLIRIYRLYYGRGQYVIPIGMLTLVVFVSALFCVRSALFDSASLAVQQAVPTPPMLFNLATISGMAGAYLWIVSDGIARMRVNDYLPSDVYAHVLRMTVAIPLGLAFATLGSGTGAFLAFAVGTFPIDTISRFIRSSATKAIGATGDADTDGDEIKQLTGVNNDVAHRLMAEGVATVEALANCDPIRLMMRTNIDFDSVLDLMDQAIVATALNTSNRAMLAHNLDALRLCGLGRASQIWGVDPNNEALMTTLPAILFISPKETVDRAQIDHLFETIRLDDKTIFVKTVISLSRQRTIDQMNVGAAGLPRGPAGRLVRPPSETADAL